jgi:hypothetical protein
MSKVVYGLPSVESLSLPEKIHRAAVKAVFDYEQGIQVRVKDKDEMEKIASAHGCDIGRITVMKCVWDNEYIKHFARIIRQAGSMYRALTLPWDKEGNIVPNSRVEELRDKLTEYQTEFFIKADEFTHQQTYERLRDEEKQKLGTLWKPEDYPSHEEARAGFKFDFQFRSLDPEDPRYFEGDTVSMVTEHLSEAYDERWKNILLDIGGRVAEGLKRLSECIMNGEPSEESIEEVMTLSKLLPDLNLIGDPSLDEMQKELTNVVHPETRKTENAQEKTLVAANKMLDKLSGIYGAAS